MTVLGTLGTAGTGSAKLISGIARKTFDGTKKAGSSILGSLRDIANPETLLKSAVAESELGSKIVDKMFEPSHDTPNIPPPTHKSPIFERSTPEVATLNGDILDKLTQIDTDIVALGKNLSVSSHSIEKTISDTTSAQTIILTKGDGYNIISDVVKNAFNPIGLPNHNERIVPALPQILNNAPSSIGKARVNEILAKEDDREDDAIAMQQADDIHAIRELISKQDKQEEKSAIDKMADKLLGSDSDGIDIDIDRRGRSRGRARPKRGIGQAIKSRVGSIIKSAPGVISTAATAAGDKIVAGANVAKNAASPVLSTAVNAGRGLISGLGSIGAGTLSAGASALLFGGTGLYSAYKATRGEDASNWISDLVDSGVQSITGDENSSLGTKIYDFFHPEEQKPTIVKTPSQPSIAPAKDKIVSSLVEKELPQITTTTKSTDTITTHNSTLVREPEPIPDAKRLEVNKMTTDKQAAAPQPVVINQPVPQQVPQQMTPGHGGGQSIAPLVTRPTDSSLKRATDKMIGGSL